MQLWYNKDDFTKDYIDKTQVEKKIKGEYIDMPEIYHYNDGSFNDLFEALAGTDNYNLFEIKPLQRIIEFNYPLVVEFIFKRLFIPYIIFQTIFVCYYNLFYEEFYNKRAGRELYLETGFLLTEENLNFILGAYHISEDI